MSQTSDMSGLWSGIYFYGADAGVPFSAWIDEADGALSGTTLEPNTFAATSAEELEANITGTRRGVSVEFTKIYAPSTGIRQPPLIYRGDVNGDFTEVTGRWAFSSLGAPSGRFKLSRLKSSAAVREEKAVPAPIAP